MKKRYQIYHMFFIIMLSIGLLIGGITWLTNQIRFLRNTVPATARVTKVEKMPMTSTYKPTFEFRTRTGTKEVRAPYATAFWDFSVGQQISIRYNRNDPDQAIPKGWLGIWLGPLLMTIAGLYLCTALTLDARDYYRKIKPDPEHDMLSIIPSPPPEQFTGNLR